MKMRSSSYGCLQEKKMLNVANQGKCLKSGAKTLLHAFSFGRQEYVIFLMFINGKGEVPLLVMILNSGLTS